MENPSINQEEYGVCEKCADIAVFGGSFDPPHVGHLEIIRLALDELPISHLFVVPAFLNPFKSDSLFPPRLRLEFMQELTRNINNVEVLDFEVASGKPTPTIETILYIKRIRNVGRIYLLLGDDQISGLRKWHSFSELSKLVSFVIITRQKAEIPHGFLTLSLQSPHSSTRIRLGLDDDGIPMEIRAWVLEMMKIYKEKSLRVDVAREIVNILDIKKAENIELFDVSDSDYLVNYVVIATALADKHASALLDTLKSELKPKGETFYAVEESDNWIVADLGDIMVHLFTENHRKKFNLEEFLTSLKKQK